VLHGLNTKVTADDVSSVMDNLADVRMLFTIYLKWISRNIIRYSFTSGVINNISL